jgi:tetratricopeptide (TPR) repeat protein
VVTKIGTPTWFDSFEADELFSLAQLDLEKGNTAEALWKLKRLTDAGDTPTGAFSVCGQVYVQLGLWDRAQQMFQRHLSLHPESVGEMFQLGLAHHNAGRAPEAMKIWDKLLEKYPVYPPALFYRAVMQVNQGQVAAARNDLDVLVKYAAVDNPFFKQAKELLQSLEFRLQTENTAVAVAPAIDRPASPTLPSAAAKPKSPDVLTARARSAYKNNDAGE